MCALSYGNVYVVQPEHIDTYKIENLMKYKAKKLNVKKMIMRRMKERSRILYICVCVRCNDQNPKPYQDEYTKKIVTLIKEYM